MGKGDTLKAQQVFGTAAVPSQVQNAATARHVKALITHGGKTWRVAHIHAGHSDKPWAWMVNVNKPAEQVRLSLKAECFQ